MGLTTARWALPYPVGTDTPDIPNWMNQLAVALDNVAMDDQGTLAARPVSTVGSPGKRGRYYYATDTVQLFRDYGTGWDEIQIGPITSADITDGTIAIADLSAAAQNNWLKLGTATGKSIKWGVADIGGWGLTPMTTFSVPHGLGVSPTHAWGNTDVGNTGGDGTDIILWSWQDTKWDATNFYIKCATRSGGNANFPGVNFVWTALV